MTARRSSFTVTPAITISALPCCTARRAESKSTSSITSSRPSFSAIRAAISGSMPMTAPVSSVVSYGGKAALVLMMSLPSSTVVKSAASALSLGSVLASALGSVVASVVGAVLGSVVDSPQAARANTITSARSSARNFFISCPLSISKTFARITSVLRMISLQQEFVNHQFE